MVAAPPESFADLSDSPELRDQTHRRSLRGLNPHPLHEDQTGLSPPGTDRPPKRRLRIQFQAVLTATSLETSELFGRYFTVHGSVEVLSVPATPD